jgi:hypothetical protein
MSGLAAETLINERACDRFRVFLAHAARAGCVVPSRPYLLGHGNNGVRFLLAEQDLLAKAPRCGIRSRSRRHETGTFRR